IRAQNARHSRSGNAVKAVASSDEVAFDALLVAAVPKPNRWRRRIEPFDRRRLGLEDQRLTGLDRGGIQVLDHLVLSVHDDRASAGQFLEIDVVVPLVEAEIDAAMNERLPTHSFANADVVEQARHIVLEDAGSR